jgi:predicted dehydrogenase
VRVGLVGFGTQMSTEYAPSIKRLRLPIDFVCDVSPVRLALASALRPGRLLESLDALPQCLTEICVIIALPHNQNAPAIEKLITKGYRLLLTEKPAALNLAEFGRVSDLINTTGTSVFVATRRRLYRSYQALKDSASSLESPRRIAITITKRFRRSEFGWRAQPDVAGPTVLFDLGYHALDLAYWLGGDPGRVQVRASTRLSMRAVSLERAAIEIECSHWPCVVEVFADRIAPSPFEQIVIDAGDKKLVATSTALFTVGPRGRIQDKEPTRIFQMGDETDRLLGEIIAGTPSSLDEYKEHRFHVAAADMATSI